MLYLKILFYQINALSKNLSSKLNYLTKHHSRKKKESFSIKMLNSKNALYSKIPTTTKKNLVKFCKKNPKKKFKKMPKKFPQKKIQKKLKKGYQDFHAPK